jgi:HEAT repeat protein
MPAPAPTAVPALPVPPHVWVPENFFPDMDLRIQALSSLMHTDAPRVIPLLREIALDSGDAGEARRALFVLAQSGRPDARSTVVEVAKTGPEAVRIAAVRELGRIGGPTVATDLLQVYSSGNERVKYHVVTSLARRDAAPALMRIAESEKDRRLRDVAIVTLGDAGGRTQLFTLYSTAPQDAKRAIVIGLFNAKAEDELIRIVERERDQAIRDEAIARLRLLGTPKARAYLETHR